MLWKENRMDDTQIDEKRFHVSYKWPNTSFLNSNKTQQCAKIPPNHHHRTRSSLRCNLIVHTSLTPHFHQHNDFLIHHTVVKNVCNHSSNYHPKNFPWFTEYVNIDQELQICDNDATQSTSMHSLIDARKRAVLDLLMVEALRYDAWIWINGIYSGYTFQSTQYRWSWSRLDCIYIMHDETILLKVLRGHFPVVLDCIR